MTVLLGNNPAGCLTEMMTDVRKEDLYTTVVVWCLKKIIHSQRRLSFWLERGSRPGPEVRVQGASHNPSIDKQTLSTMVASLVAWYIDNAFAETSERKTNIRHRKARLRLSTTWKSQNSAALCPRRCRDLWQQDPKHRRKEKTTDQIRYEDRDR